MAENKNLLWIYLSMAIMSSLTLEAKNLPFYNGGFEVWEKDYNGYNYTDMPSGWETSGPYPIDLRKEDNYHTNPNLPRQGQYALYYFDTSFNRPIKTKGYTLSEGTYTYSVYASTMGWVDTYITLTVDGDITTSKRMEVKGSWTKYSITFTLEETATVYLGIDNKTTYSGTRSIAHFIVDDCSLETTDGNLISSEYDYIPSDNSNFTYYLYSNGEAELVKCNDKSIGGKLEMPSTLTKDGIIYKIRKISCNAFEDCKNISEVILPSYLYEVGTEAFINCSSLKTLVVSNRVTSISGNAFAGCGKLEYVELFAKERVAFKSNSFPANENLCLYVSNVDDYRNLTTINVKSLAFINSNLEYSGEKPNVTYAYAPGVNVTNIDLSSLSPNVGTYNLPSTFTHTSGLTVNGFIKLNIEKRTLTIQANSVNREYGNNNPALTLSYSGFINGENEGVLTTEPTVNTTATKTSNVGEYPITVSGGSAKNYTFVYEPGILTVTKAPLTAKVNDETRLYGQDNPTFTISYNGLKNEETAPKWSEALKISTSSTKESDVGTYTVSATGTPTNYDLQSIGNGTLTITPAPLTVKANNANRLYYEDEPTFNYSCIGFVNNDNVNVLTKAPSFVTEATKASNVGTYKIIPNGAQAKNYAISYETGELTITKRTLKVTSHSKRPYGEENPVLPIEYVGFVNNETDDVISTKPIATTAAKKTSSVGNYPITVSGGDATNYSFVYEQGVFTIEKASLLVKVNDATRVYGSPNPIFTIEYYGLKNGETVPTWTTYPSFDTEATLASGVGQYVIKAINGVAVNYDLEILDGTLSITPASLTIRAYDETIVYGDELQSLGYGIIGFVNGDDIWNAFDQLPRVTTTATSTSNVGTYEIKVEETSCPNYSITYFSGTLTITKAPLTISVGNYTKEVGEDNPTFNPVYYGFKNGETNNVLTHQPIISCTATINSPVGTYPITISGADAKNYTFIYQSGTLIVKEKPNNIINFADSNVKYICVKAWDTNSDGELSKQEASAVNDIGTVFKYNSSITSFNELQYFTGITVIGNQSFIGCSSLYSVTIPEQVTRIEYNAFQGCSNIKFYVDKGTDGLLSVWNYGADPYEKGTSQLLLRPSMSMVSTTQTSIKYQVNNVYPELEYQYDNNSTPLGNNEYLITGLRPEHYYSTSLIAKSANNSYSTKIEAGTSPISPTLACENVTASSLSVKGSYTKGDAKVVSCTLIMNGKEMGSEVGTLYGLDPNKSYSCKYKVVVEDANGNYYNYTGSNSFYTNRLNFATQQPKVISAGNVIVAADTNLSEEETNVGFEWRRKDWTDDFESKSGGAYLYGGRMEGYIRNLNTDKLWKYRAYYVSDTGKAYYGEWKGIDPTDTSYFDPTVHTYARFSVKDNTAEVKGYAMRGTEDVKKQGFMYWKKSSSSTRGNAKSIPANAMVVEAKGNVMIATLENLDYDTEYCYVAFATTTKNVTFYGEEQTFKTGAASQDVIDGIEGTKDADNVTEVARYDLNGRKIANPQKGINIIRYSDGTSRKILVK